jgi:hypothetical protein
MEVSGQFQASTALFLEKKATRFSTRLLECWVLGSADLDALKKTKSYIPKHEVSIDMIFVTAHTNFIRLYFDP